jgi:hypothetical protein
MSNGSDDDNTKLSALKHVQTNREIFNHPERAVSVGPRHGNRPELICFKIRMIWMTHGITAKTTPHPQARTVDDFNMQIDWDLGIGTLTILPPIPG